MHWDLRRGHPNTFATSTTRSTKIPHCNAQCSPQQRNWKTDGNAPSLAQPKVHQVMGRIVHQGAWRTSPRCVWNERYRHHCLHWVQQNTAQQEEAHHLRKDGGYVLTRERWSKSNEVHCWWWLDSASWQCKHTDGQDDDSENASQQRDIDKRSTLLHSLT